MFQNSGRYSGNYNWNNFMNTILLERFGGLIHDRKLSATINENILFHRPNNPQQHINSIIVLIYSISEIYCNSGNIRNVSTKHIFQPSNLNK